MTATDEELRALVRDAITRLRSRQDAVPPAPAVTAPVHASHARFLVGAGGDGDGACLIEPAVRCNRCGYCQSYGH
jgi:hypothetical protein